MNEQSPSRPSALSDSIVQTFADVPLEAFHSAIVEAALDCVVMIDHEGRILEFNPAAEATFGYQRKDVLGRPMAELIVPPSLREAHHAGLRRYLETGAGPVLGKRIEITAMHSSGREFPVELAIKPIRIPGAQPLFTAYLRDITDRQRKERRQAAEYAAISCLADAENVATGLQKLLESILSALRWKASAYWRIDEVDSVLRCAAFADLATEPKAEFQTISRQFSFARGIGLPGRVWGNGQPHWILDVTKDMNFPRAQFAARAGLHCALGVPVKRHGQVIGVVEFFSDCIEEPDEDLLLTMAIVGNQIGEFIERCQAQEALKDREQRLDLAIKGADLGVWDWNIQTGVVHFSRRWLEMLGYSINEIESNVSSWERLVHPDDMPRVRQTLQAHLDGRTTFYETEHRLKTKSGEWKWILDRGSVIERDPHGVPIRASGTHLDITERNRSRQVIEEARVREIDTAVAIQNTLLLGTLPENLSGASIATLSIPSQGVDGDFFDFIPYGDKLFDLILGDVMGKGIPAALLAAATKSKLLRGFNSSGLNADTKMLSPAQIVTRLNAEMCSQLIGLERFVTLCYARFNLGGGCLEVVDGGHTKTVHFRKRLGITTFIEGPNVPLGWLANETYQQVSVALEPGDVLLFYSDGITEASNGDGEQFGGARLAEFVAGSHALSAQQVLQRLRSELVQFCGRETFADDLNCIAVKIDKLDGQISRRCVQLKLESQMSELARARNFVRQFCHAECAAGAPAPNSFSDQLELAVHETLTNVIEHGYHNRADQSITLELQRRDQAIVVHIYHDGETFRPEGISAPKVEDFAERGYGLYIIDQCVDQVEYSRAASGRQCITLVKSVA